MEVTLLLEVQAGQADEAAAPWEGKPQPCWVLGKEVSSNSPLPELGLVCWCHWGSNTLWPPGTPPPAFPAAFGSALCRGARTVCSHSQGRGRLLPAANPAACLSPVPLGPGLAITPRGWGVLSCLRVEIRERGVSPGPAAPQPGGAGQGPGRRSCGLLTCAAVGIYSLEP